MHSLSQKCNALAAVNEIFLHSCNTPDKVIKALAHMGISISSYTIETVIQSLSWQSVEAIHELGQSLVAAYRYDNFDINLPTMTPKVNKSSKTLLHLTSSDILFLNHGVTKEDLRCSRELWEKCPLNPTSSLALLSHHSFDNLLTLHLESTHPSGLTRWGKFNSWKFLHDLIHHGSVKLRKLIPTIGKAEDIDAIPVTKLQHHPTWAIDINQSRVDGNIEAISNLLSQRGIGDSAEQTTHGQPNSTLVDIFEYVALVHGNLSTCERIQSILKVQSIEKTPWWCYQFVIFVLGLFHLKMACADAIWRLLIQPPSSRHDDNSLMHYIGVLHPKKTGKIGSSPKFHQMHDVINHAGIALHLNAWCVEAVKWNADWKTLEDLADSDSSIEDLHCIADDLARHYVHGEGHAIYTTQRQPFHARNQQQENVLLMHEYLLLYEEISYAMNAGNIKRVETLLPIWIALFKATSKYKYANQMMKFMTDLHFVYPNCLRSAHRGSYILYTSLYAHIRCAIRMNILVNPTGKLFAFHAVDWVVELNNLFTKVSHIPGKECITLM